MSASVSMNNASASRNLKTIDEENNRYRIQKLDPIV